jgi:hypothetical protein
MEDSRLLGPVIKAWFKLNEWPQSVSEGLARAKGWTAGPWASQISICMAGRLTPKPNFFSALGMFNDAVATRDFQGVTDRRLMDRLKAGQPIVHDDCCVSCEAGTPWTAMDFFGCYIGAVKPPKNLSGPQTVALTQEIVDEWARGLRGAFRELCLTMMATPAKAWSEVNEECLRAGIAPDEIEWAQEVVSGFREPTLEEAQRLMQKWGEGQPLVKAFMTLQERHGGDTRRLKKFQAWRERLQKPQPGEGFESLPLAPEPMRRFGFDPEAGAPKSLMHGPWGGAKEGKLLRKRISIESCLPYVDA